MYDVDAVLEEVSRAEGLDDYGHPSFRDGLDVLAALSLGADAVFLGRLPLLALVGGAPGVAALHRELRAQTVDALRLAGCRAAADARHLL